MDFAYLNAVLRSTTMPPLDPWFAGGALNYYYYGQFMVATVIRATGIPSAVAYNLAVPLFFALTAGAAFSLGYNITEGARRWLRRAIRPPRWSAIAAGGAAVAMTVVLGNLHGGGQLLRGAVSNFDFWAPTRMMPPDPPGFEITEFPFFTFLFADLHAHLMAMPLALLAIGLCLNTVLLSRRGIPPWRFALSFALLALTAGAMAITNTWDFPTYVGLGAVSIVSGSVAGVSTSEPGAGLSDCGAPAAVRHVGLGLLASVSPAVGERLSRPRRRPGDDALGPVPRNTRTVHLRAANPAGGGGFAAHLALGVNARRPLAIGAGLCGRCSGVTRHCIDGLRPWRSGNAERRSPGLVGPAAWVGLPPTLALGRHTRLGQRRSALQSAALGTLGAGPRHRRGSGPRRHEGRHRSAEHRVQALPAGMAVLCARRVICAVAFGLRARVVHPPSLLPGLWTAGLILLWPLPLCTRYWAPERGWTTGSRRRH